MKVLLLFQDNILADIPTVQTDFVSTGSSFTSGTPAQRKSATNVNLFTALCRVLSGHYDWALLPAIDLNWQWDKDAGKKTKRNIIGLMLKSRLIGSAARLLWPKKTRVAVLDRYDTWEPFLAVPRFFGAVLYFKGHFVPRETPSEPGMRYERLPWWVFSENYRCQLPISQREHDLFFAMTISSEIRQEALEMAEYFAQQGLRVLAPREAITFQDYIVALENSRFVLAPEGTGYCCFRHYESMLTGAIPVVNENAQGYDLDLVDGENCIFYKRGEQDSLLRRLQGLLADSEALKAFSERARTLALANNTQEAVGRYVLSKLTAFEEADRPVASALAPI